ncbi:hypothetical protein [Winogradskyella forsetii]|uniref:hypothetical protein n=1 Tax=Winogradskyella forsetii TaxID=2686077 RepID=UPI0015BA97F8|nr:hypothetical protein [Winogradskyella forsetii]
MDYQAKRKKRNPTTSDLQAVRKMTIENFCEVGFLNPKVLQFCEQRRNDKLALKIKSEQQTKIKHGIQHCV